MDRADVPGWHARGALVSWPGRRQSRLVRPLGDGTAVGGGGMA
jgi:hypothetical protein